MPLVRQELDLPLTAGLAQSARSESRDVMAGFDTVQNTVQEQAGAWVKRPGAEQLLGAAPATIVGLHTHRGEVPIVRGATNLYTHAGSAYYDRGAAPWLDVDRTPIASQSVAGIVGGVPVTGLTAPVLDTAQTNGIVGIVYATTEALFAACYDATTKAPVSGPTLLHAFLGNVPYIVDAQIQPVLVSAGNYLIAIWRRIPWPAGAGEDGLWWSRFDTTNPAGGWAAPALLIGAGVLFIGAYVLTYLNNYIRPVAIGMSDRFIVATRIAAGGGTLLVRSFDLTGAVIASATPFGATIPGTYAIGGHRTDWYVWVAHSQLAGVNVNGNVNLVALDATTLATVGAVLAAAWPEQPLGGQVEGNQCIGILSTNQKLCTMVVGNRHWNPAGVAMTQGYLGWRTYEVDGGGNVAATSNVSSAYNLLPYSRPWTQNGRTLVCATPQDTFNNPTSNDQYVRNWQRNFYVVDITEERYGAWPGSDVDPVASVAPRTCLAFGGYQPELWTHQVATMPAGHAAIAVPVLRSGVAGSIDLVELPTATSSTAGEVGGVLHLSGGAATSFDGVLPHETSFLETPRVRVEAATAGPGLTGTFYYVAVYEWIDAQGNVHQSAPSAPVSTGALANQTANLTITTTNCNLKENRPNNAARVRIVLYRTTGTPGSTYYRLNDFTNYEPASATWFRGYVTYADATPDAAVQPSGLTARPRLYTQPGTAGTSLPRYAPSALRSVVQHGDVIAGIGDNGRRIWFSAPRVDGEGAWFSDLMIVEVEDTSPLVALASLDGRLFAFSRTGIHVIDGTGYAENGTGGYSLPQRLPTDAGCIEPRSVVVTPSGVLFQSELGIALLSRAGQVQLFGGAVQTTLAASPTIRAAVLDAANGRALFHCTGASSLVLVYDYTAGVWSTWTRGDGAYAVGVALVDGLYHWASSAGAVLKESTNWLDGSTFVGQTFETGWIKLGGLAGFQRVWRVILRFRLRSACELTVRFAFDYSDSYTETKTIAEADLTTAGTVLELAPARQRCAALRVKIEETAPAAAGTGQGFELLGIRVVWAKDGRYGHSAGQHK